jgi:hypothetical protein
MSVTQTASGVQTDAPPASGPVPAARPAAPASAFPVTSGDTGTTPGWGCRICGIHEDAPTVDLARVRVTTHIVFVHGDVVNLARQLSAPELVTPAYLPGRPA